MRGNLFIVTIFFYITILSGQSQNIIEIGIKPSEFLLQNFETNFAIGNKNLRLGFYLSYRPSTQESGEVKAIGTGIAGTYGQSFNNKFYTSYTLGIYQKTYIKKGFFLEADLFYRNWSFKNKYVEFYNIEGYEFQGIRTENIDVFGLKLLIGKTLILSKKEKKVKPYIDVYIGGGIRRKTSTYKTFNGYINEVYYEYKKEHFTDWFPTPQVGVKLGLILAKQPLATTSK